MFQQSTFGQDQKRGAFGFGSGLDGNSKPSAFGQNSSTSLFGQPVTGTSTGFGFGAQNQNQNQTQTQTNAGSFFSKPQQPGNQTNTNFGNSQNSSFGFAPSQNQTQLSGGLFGQNQNSGGIFGQQQQQSSNLFGQGQGQRTNSFSQPQVSTSSFGQPSSVNNLNGLTQKPPASNLFSQSQPASTQPGLFGNTLQPSGTTQSGGLFGQNQQTSQPGKLFGSTTNTPTTGLFGNTANNSTSGAIPQAGTATNTSTGLFGTKNSTGFGSTPGFGTSSTAPSTVSGSTGLFGKPAASSLFNSQPSNSLTGIQGSSGLFTNTNQSTVGASTGGLFGQSKYNSGLFSGQNGGSIFNPNSNQPLNQQQQNQQINITPFTRPSDLTEVQQNELEAVDKYITQQMRIADDIGQELKEHKKLVEDVPQDVSLLKHICATSCEALMLDDRRLKDLKIRSNEVVADAERCFEVLANTNLGASGLSQRMDRKNDRFRIYFARIVSSFQEKLDQLSLAVQDATKGVGTLESHGDAGILDPQHIPGTLKAEYEYFMSLSDRVAELHQTAGRLQQA